MTGRLVEIAVPDGYRSVADVEAMIVKLTQAMNQLDATSNAVVVADWRQCKVLTAAVAERAVLMMSAINERIERSAILHDADSSTSVLQLMRLIKETNTPHRRLFTDPAQLREWLGEVLDARENDRLREFLSPARSSRR